jgi:hypothetical protein
MPQQQQPQQQQQQPQQGLMAMNQQQQQPSPGLAGMPMPEGNEEEDHRQSRGHPVQPARGVAQTPSPARTVGPRRGGLTGPPRSLGTHRSPSAACPCAGC